MIIAALEVRLSHFEWVQEPHEIHGSLGLALAPRAQRLEGRAFCAPNGSCWQPDMAWNEKVMCPVRIEDAVVLARPMTLHSAAASSRFTPMTRVATAMSTFYVSYNSAIYTVTGA